MNMNFRIQYAIGLSVHFVLDFRLKPEGSDSLRRIDVDLQLAANPDLA